MLLSTRFFTLLLSFIPFIFYIVVSLKKKNPYELNRLSSLSYVFLLLIMATLMGLFPLDEGDRLEYANEYFGIKLEGERADIGYGWYLALSQSVLGGNIVLYFLIISFFYTFSYLIFAHRYFPKVYLGYFIIMVCGSLGFASYGYNTLRQGLAIAFFLLAFGASSKLWARLPLLFLAVAFHMSLIILVVASIGAKFLKDRKTAELFWLLCLIMTIVGLDLGTMMDSLSQIDSRIGGYYSSAEDGTADYNNGFRIDFLIYSILPIYIARFWMNKYKYLDAQYIFFYKLYLYVNAVWLLMIRIQYTDRIAYMSWFLIPVLTLYPLLNQGLNMKNVQKTVNIVMGIFIGINLLLNLR